MSINQVSSSAEVNAIFNSQTTQAVKEEDPLGRDAFLTMLVAQLKHQDPLNPMEGADFSAQLAQFSTLEQMFKVNENLENIESAIAPDTEENLMDYIGKEVTGVNNSLRLEDSETVEGQYTIGEKANILISIYNDAGVQVATVLGGQKEAGTHSFEWDGTDDYGDTMLDGSYSYEVLAVDENYETVEVDTLLSGTVTGVTYENGSGYLLIGDKLVDPTTVTRVGQESAEA